MKTSITTAGYIALCYGADVLAQHLTAILLLYYFRLTECYSCNNANASTFKAHKSRPSLMTMTTKYLPPTYLDNFVTYDKDKYFKDLIEIEWRGQIKSSNDHRRFKIKYFGNILEKYNCIVGTDFAPSLVYAVDTETGEEILLFDGCKHGYHAMLCDTFTNEQITNRPLTQTFIDKFGCDTFEVIVKVYNGIPYEEELKDFQNEDGTVALVSGEIVSADTLVRNGFNYLEIKLINKDGQETVLVEEELA